ncbi:hypothetical protein M3936_19305 [Sutcliffiella horikoshii]|uniref:hypothetical protein n=1 Tax=Sutcliffiella horikoshii TaxID=79883 RepID=UPI002040C262|nr:hypothetical protein [Sutcliffiella horikoshii]MCM3619721.1 hypothetical protein [Sutcliffiella horikoshii]
MTSLQNVDSISQYFSFEKSFVKGIIVPVEFIYQLMSVEKQYKLKETFTSTLSSRERRLHHVTKSDIMTALSLFVSCNASGVISEVTPHRLYKERVAHLFPLSFQEFYTSLEKFKHLSLINVDRNEYTKRISIAINYFINKEKSLEGKKPILHRYVVVHPIVFNQTFIKLPASAWKLYLVQLSRSHKSYRTYNFAEEKDVAEKPIYQSSLKTLLLKQQNSDVKNVIMELIDTKLEGQALFVRPLSAPLFERRGKRFEKANLMINPVFILHKVPKEEYRFPLHPEETYPRQASFIENEFAREGVGELTSGTLKWKYKGSLFKNLVYILKDQSRKAIKHAVTEIAELWKESRQLPYNIEQFVEKSIRHKREIEYKRILREEQIYDYLVYGYKRGSKQEDRIFTFINTLSHLSLKEFRAVSRIAYKKMTAMYATTKSELRYRTNPDLDRIPGIELVRQRAEQLKISTNAYEALEYELIGKVLPYTKEDELHTLPIIMMKKLDSLEREKHVFVKTPYGFKLENLLLEEYNKNRFRLTSSILINA